MSLVLVDSSAWIDYFRGSSSIDVERFNNLIDNNRICVNELILSELIPSIIHRKEAELVTLLKSVKSAPVRIGWEEIIQYQTINLAKGLNNIGIPDLIIMQNALQNDLIIYSTDKHFLQLKHIHRFRTL